MGANAYTDAIDALDDQAQPTQQPANPYLETLDGLEGSRTQALRTATIAAHDQQPDRAAEVGRLSTVTGLAPEVVERNFDDLAKRVKVDGVPYQKILSESPHLAEWASDPHNQAVAKDDMEQLGLLEWIVSAPQRSFAQTVHQMRFGELRTASLYRELTQEERDLLQSEKYNSEAGGKLGAGDSWFRGAVTGSAQFLANILYGVKASAPEIAIGAATGAAIGGIAGGGAGAVPGAKFGAEVGGLIGGAKFAFNLEAGLAYDEYLGFGTETGELLDPAVAKAAAFATGAINAGLEVGGLALVMKTIPGLEKLGSMGVKSAVKQALRNPTIRASLGAAVKGYGKALTAETATEVAQRAVTILAGEIGKYASGTGGAQRTPSDVLSDLASEGSSALQSFALGLAVGPAFGVQVNARKAARAAQGEAFFNALAEGVTNSKTVQRMPEAAQAFLAKATAGGPVENVYAPIDTFKTYWQEKGLDPAQVAAELTGDRDAFGIAERTGEDLAIPTSTYAVKMAGTEHHAFFAQELRLGPDEMNAREATAFQESMQAAKDTLETPELSSSEQVRQQLLEQLVSSGVPADTAAQYAALYENTFGAIAERAGMDPAALYAKYGLTVHREGLQPLAAGGNQPANKRVETSTSTAAFLGHGPGIEPGTAAPLYNIQGGEHDGSTVTADRLQELGITVPSTPAFTGEQLSGEQLREKALAVREEAKLKDLLGPGGYAGEERRSETRVDSAVEDARYQADRQERAAMAAKFKQGSPAALENAAMTAARAGLVDNNVAAGDTEEAHGSATAGGEQLPDDAREPGALPGGGQESGGGAGLGSDEGARERVPPSARGHFEQLLADARAHGFTGSDDSLAARYLEQVEKAQTIAADLTATEEDHSWRAFLGEISKGGGISFDKDPTSVGELEWFADALGTGDRIIKKSGRNRVARQGQRMPFNSAGIPGAPGIIKARGGKSFDGMREYLAQDGRWSHLTDVNDFMRMLEDAVFAAKADRDGTLRGSNVNAQNVLEEFLEVKPGRQWWIESPGNLLEENDLTDEDVNGPAEGGDTSFNVEEFGQGLFDDVAPVHPTADVLTTGEVQPRLPGAEEVRETETATPQLDAPFALTSEVSQRKGKQTTLFQGASGEFTAPAASVDEAITSQPTAVVAGVADARVVPFPVLSDEQALRLWMARDRTKVERKSVPIAKLVATQRTFSEAVVRDYVDAPSEELPDGMELNGVVALAGGHHRAIAAWAQGQTSIDVEVVQVDPTKLAGAEFGQPAPALTPTIVADFERELRAQHGEDLALLSLYLVGQGDLELAALAIARGAQRAGLGSKVMRDITRFADEHGVRIMLSPGVRDDSWGTTSRSRLVKFYKRFGFVENKGRRMDFSISAGMYREPTVPLSNLPAAEGRELGQPVEPAPTFYSGMSDVVARKMPARADAAQILGILRNPQNGVRAEELKWSGLEDWLADQAGAIEKTQVVAFLEAHRIEIRETLKGEHTVTEKESIEAQARLARANDTLRAYLLEEKGFTENGVHDYLLDTARSHLGGSQEELARADAKQWALMMELRQAYIDRSWLTTNVDTIAVTKFAKYTMPGGTNYRELLLQLPEPSEEDFTGPTQRLEPTGEGLWHITFDGMESGSNLYALLMRYDATGFAQSNKDFPLDDFGNVGRGFRAVFRDHSFNADTFDEAVEWAKSYQGDVIKEIALSHWRRERTYYSPHWKDEKNVLAHVRYNERVTHDGKTVLFVEEIQSDWHQQGRRRGYREELQPITLTAIRDLDDIYEVDFSDGTRSFVGKGTIGSKATDEEVRAYYAGILARKNKQQSDAQSDRPPEAPFRTTWPELAFKRMIRLAAEKGVDVLAWTPGAVQADRYDLSKQVAAIDYISMGPDSGKWNVHIVTLDEGTEHLGEFTASGLEDMVGKEVADKIAKGEGARSKRTGLTRLEGLELQVGGEGMRGFYDGMLPKFAGKYVKKWGASVADVYLGSDASTALVNNDSPSAAAAIGAAPVHGIAITPAMKESVLQVGQTLFAPERRGSIRFGADRQFTINLFERADLSTFLHESGHFFLEVLGDVANTIAAIPPEGRSPQQQQLLADLSTLNGWLVDEDHTAGGFSEKQHEQFARGFEAYLMQGTAPSLELRAVFARFRAWLIGIYRTLKGLNVQLTPEVRQIFDRMVATDRAIAEAQQAGDVFPIFTTPESAGMSPAQFALYRDKVTDASRIARERLEQQLLAEVQREQTAQWREQRNAIEAEVAAEVFKRPVYQALAAMQRGTHPDGSPLSETLEVEPYKLSRQILVARYGKERLARLPKPYIYSVDGGLDPDGVAQAFDFSSGDELLTAVEQAPPMRQVIKQETDRLMLERYGSMLLDGSLHEAAQAALSTDAHEEIVRAELRALGHLRRTVSPFVQAERLAGAEAIASERKERAYERRWLEAEARLRIAVAEGRKQVEIDELRDEIRTLREKAKRGPAIISAAIPPAGVMRDAARARIGRTRLRDLKPQAFWSASRNASRKAIDAAAKQDFEGAIVAKQQELLNLALYREAERAKTEIEARVKRAKDLGKGPARARLGLAGEAYLDQVDGILDRFEFATVSKKVLDRRASLRRFIAALEGEGMPVDLPEELLEEQRRVNYQELPIEELTGVLDGLDAIVHLARLKNRLLKNAERRELDATAGTLSESIREHARTSRTQKVASDRRPAEERRRAIADFFAGHRKLASTLRELDGFQDGGPAWEAIMRPLNEAGAREAQMNADATNKFAEIVERAFPGKQKRSLYTKSHIPAVGQSLSKMQRLMVAMNWGNAGNRDRVRRAHGWDDRQVQAILDTLSESDLRFVQDAFDLIDGFWPEIEAKQKRVYGVAPEKVTAIPITAAGGAIKGGYFPLKYDDRLSAGAIASLDLEAANLAKQAAYAQATTKRGHTKERAARVKMPVRLDFGVMFEHVQQVIHDLTHHEALVDVGRILGHRDVQAAILETQGDLVYKQIRNTVRDVAFGDVPAVNGFERAINHVRVGATVAGLGWNLGVALLQPIGLTNSIARIGPTWVARGVARWIRNPFSMVETVKWIEDSSEFMRSRGRTQQREIAEVRNSIGVSTGTIGGWVDEALSKTTFDLVTRQGIADSYFWMIQQAQRIADVPTWLGQYEKSMAAGETEDRAIALADQAVLDSQGGGQTKDLAQVQRGGPMMKLWTNFYSYFNVVYNQAAESRRRTRLSHPAEVGRLASDYFMLFIVPATLGFLIREALRPTMKPDDDDDALVWRIALENVSYLSGTMLGLREVSGVLAGSYGYEGPAGARAFAALGRLGQQVRQGDTDAAFWRSLNDVAGVLLHYPASQAWKTSTGVAAVAEGKTSNPGAIVAGPPRGKQ